MKPAIIILDPHTQGDTWQGIETIGPILISVDGAPAVQMAYPIASARMYWRKSESHPVVARLSTTPALDVSPILLVGTGETWELTIPPIQAALFPLTKGMWYSQLEITDTAGTVWTTHECHLSVGQDLTQ